MSRPAPSYPAAPPSSDFPSSRSLSLLPLIPLPSISESLRCILSHLLCSPPLRLAHLYNISPSPSLSLFFFPSEGKEYLRPPLGVRIAIPLIVFLATRKPVL